MPLYCTGTTITFSYIVSTNQSPGCAFLRNGLQDALTKVVGGVGGFSHAKWRSFHNEHRNKTAEARNYVDGDLVESFLDLR